MEHKRLVVVAIVILVILAGLFFYSHYQLERAGPNPLENSTSTSGGDTGAVSPEVMRKLTAPPGKPVVVPPKILNNLTAPKK